jgi:hypothetical protein
MASLPVLADFLEENLGLVATAGLLRCPDLHDPPKETELAGAFDYYPLDDAVFVWLTESRYSPKPNQYETKPCVLVGLYAHPTGREKNWAKITRMLPGKESRQRDPARPWQKLPRKDDRVEQARMELVDFVKRNSAPAL